MSRSTTTTARPQRQISPAADVGRLQASRWRATSRSRRRSPLPPMRMGGCGVVDGRRLSLGHPARRRCPSRRKSSPDHLHGVLDSGEALGDGSSLDAQCAGLGLLTAGGRSSRDRPESCAARWGRQCLRHLPRRARCPAPPARGRRRSRSAPVHPGQPAPGPARLGGRWSKWRRSGRRSGRHRRSRRSASCNPTRRAGARRRRGDTLHIMQATDRDAARSPLAPDPRMLAGRRGRRDHAPAASRRYMRMTMPESSRRTSARSST